MKSPCIKVCVIDDASGLCAGCHRSLAEIATWGSMGVEKRRQIMGQLAARRSLAQGLLQPVGEHG